MTLSSANVMQVFVAFLMTLATAVAHRMLSLALEQPICLALRVTLRPVALDTFRFCIPGLL